MPQWLKNLVILYSGFLSASAGGQEVDLVYLFSDGQMPVTSQAYRVLLSEHPELVDRVRVRFVTESLFADVNVEDVVGADVLVFDIMNQQILQRFNSAHGVNLINRVSTDGHVFTRKSVVDAIHRQACRGVRHFESGGQCISQQSRERDKKFD